MEFITRIALASKGAKFPFTQSKQGQTMEQVGLYLYRLVFSHGQLYVALSRVRDRSSIHIYTTDGRAASTTNCVFTKLLNALAGVIDTEA